MATEAQALRSLRNIYADKGDMMATTKVCSSFATNTEATSTQIWKNIPMV